MKKKIIFIIIESAKRELDSKILLSLKALKKNFRVVIGHKGALREMIKDTNPGIMVLKSFGPRNTQHIDFLKKKKFKVVSSDEEMITAIDFEDKLDYRINNENLKKIDLFLAVGEKSDIPIIRKNYNWFLKNVLVCGNMRLELLKKKYRQILEKETDVIKKKFGNYILLLTAFPRINKINPIHRIDWVYHRIVEDNIDPDSNNIHIANEQVIMQRQILLQTIKFIDNFEKNSLNKNLVILPHPNENIFFWKNYINKRKFKKIYLHAEKLTSSNAFIYASEIVISSNSTTLLEAFFLEKKIINFLGNEQNIAEINLLKKISKIARSSDELFKCIKELDLPEYKNSITYELDEIKNFEETYDIFDGILNAFEKLENVNSFDNLFPNFFYVIISKLRMFWVFIKKVVSFKLKLKPRIEYLYKEKIGNTMSKKNFIKKILYINSFEKTENLIIKQIASEVFLIDANNKN